MEINMINNAQTMYEQGKKSLETLLREKSYEEVKELLQKEGIDINDVSDEDVEFLVAERIKEKKNGLKDMATGAAFALLLSSIIGF